MNPRAQAGFTLVELLVALTIVSLLAVMMTGGLGFLARAEDSRAAHARSLEGALAGFGLVHEALGRAQPFFARERNQPRLVFDGTSERMRFIGREPAFVPGAPLLGYELAVTSGRGRYQLELRRALMPPAEVDLDLLDSAPPRVLLVLPRPVTFSYFGPAGRNQAPEWSGMWQDRSAMPLAVRLSGGESPSWPEIVVRLHVDTPASCAAAAGNSPECQS